MNIENGKPQKINEMIEQKKDSWRLGFHLMPPTGWLNDPNGLCWYKGDYHVFFQYAPSDPSGGLKHWGHYKSKDMVSWEYMGIALYPDCEYDRQGVYSGSALVENDRMHLFYTGNVKYPGPYDYIFQGRESNTIHVSSEDGIHFSKKECVMTNADYPQNCTCHVRDPKVFKQGETYYMVQGARRIDNVGEILVFESKDLHKWKFINSITTKEPFGYMWECPDYFELGDKKILITCPQGVLQDEKYQNLYQNGYFVLGEEVQELGDVGEFALLDYGTDFYAPQTFEDPSGRRILIGWAGMPDAEYQNPTVEQGWQHCMTVPRVLTWKNGRLCQNPAAELEALREEEREYSFGHGVVLHPPGMYEVYFEIESIAAKIIIRDGGHGRTELSYEAETGVLRLELFGEMSGGREPRSVPLDSLRNLRILADTSILEIYINDGEQVMTTRYYPKGADISLEIVGSGTLTLWKLRKANEIYVG